MRLFLVGADIEENLALGILTAVAEQQGHNARVLGFNDESQSASIVEQIVGAAPDVVGLSMQFQHRADEFLSLSRSLRDAGYEGHLRWSVSHLGKQRDPRVQRRCRLDRAL